MFRRVLFPTDFSTYADAILSCLVELRAAGTREIVLLHVIRPGDIPLGHSSDQALLDRLRWGVKQRLDVLSLALEGQSFVVTSRLREGRPAEEIVQVAREEGIGMVVMGAQGVTPAQELLLGSTALEVVRICPVPVLIYKFEMVCQMDSAQCRKLCAHTFERVLHPTDFSKCAKAAFNVVKRLRAAGTQEVILLHVQDERVMRHRPPSQLAEFDRIDTERLEKMQRALTLYQLKCRIQLRHGIPFVEALQVAEKENVSLIVLGSQGQSALHELFVGSTFENIVRQARHPVLVVRGESADDQEA